MTATALSPTSNTEAVDVGDHSVRLGALFSLLAWVEVDAMSREFLLVLLEHGASALRTRQMEPNKIGVTQCFGERLLTRRYSMTRMDSGWMRLWTIPKEWTTRTDVARRMGKLDAIGNGVGQERFRRQDTLACQGGGSERADLGALLRHFENVLQIQIRRRLNHRAAPEHITVSSECAQVDSSLSCSPHRRRIDEPGLSIRTESSPDLS